MHVPSNASKLNQFLSGKHETLCRIHQFWVIFERQYLWKALSFGFTYFLDLDK